MHFLAVAAGGIRTALFSSGPSSPSFSGPSEMPGLPSVCGRLSLNAQTKPTNEAPKGKKTTLRLSATPTPLLAQREHQLRDLVMLMLCENQLRLLLVHVAGQSASL
jgi:hypothetical protein